MKKILFILMLFSVTMLKAQFSLSLVSDELLKDTTITIQTYTRGEIDVFVETDTLYGTTKDATIQIKQRVAGFDRGIQLEGGFATLSDTLNSYRFVKGKTPYGLSYTDIVIRKNTIDSTRINISASWQSY